MATNAVSAANQTKYAAGGSGSNIIAAGQIKSVEKVWLDNYTLTSVITLTNTTITIATLPEGATLTSIDVVVDTSLTQSSGTIGLGWGCEADGAAWGSLIPETNLTHNLTTTTVRFPAPGIVNNLNAANGIAKISGVQSSATGTKNTIAVKLNNWTMSSGTLKTIVRYT